MITPKALYQRTSKEEAAKLATLVTEAWFQRALTYARAQLSSDGISAEQLSGANHFIEVFTSLADEPKPAPELPDKSQLRSYNK
jgi:hypothetical protein